MYILTLIAIAAAWFWIWRKYQDPFYPAVYLLPQFAFLYGYMPWTLVQEDPLRFAFYSGHELVYRYHLIAIVCIAAMTYGTLMATRGAAQAGRRWASLEFDSPDALYLAGVGLGVIGFWVWYSLINTAGGFAEAYGEAYGGGRSESGFLIEYRYIGLIGAILIYSVRAGRGMRPIDWLLVLLCVAPTTVQGLLGARRGPTFLSATVLAGGYVFFMQKRIPLPVVVAGGLGVGLAMLFLVASRDQIYLGSDWTNLESPLEFLDRWNSNEYLIGVHVMNYADHFGSYHGLREIGWLIARAMPDWYWPTVYRDIPDLLGIRVDLTINGGIDPIAVAYMAPFQPPYGSAPGYVGDIWLEFGIWSIPVTFLIGYLYGAVWRGAAHSGMARVMCIILAMFSVYLVMQQFNAWSYRLLLYGVPALLILRLNRSRPVSPQPAAASPGGRALYPARGVGP